MDDTIIQNDVTLDEGDALYPCHECGEILEEGKAFELGGKRWHIDCFRCNTCGTLLDSDANILLLGDGSLICNNCTYSCSFCGNKIEDIAILTGDQAFCASCFKCRNCKRQIENLRYARTSQGIFCMECHDSLMARRRKRTARNAIQQQHGRSKPPGHANMHLDKSLPSLPPAAKPGSRRGSPARHGNLNGTVDEGRNRSGSHARSAQSPMSPPTSSRETAFLPAATYRPRGESLASQRSDYLNEEYLIPVAFDPSPHRPPAEAPSSASTTRPPPDDRSPELPPRPTFQPQPYDSPGSQVSTHLSSPLQNGRSGGDHPPRSRGANNFDSPLASPFSLNASVSNNNNNIASFGEISTQSATTRAEEDRLGKDSFRLQEVPKRKKGDSQHSSATSSRAPPPTAPNNQSAPASVTSSAVNAFSSPQLPPRSVSLRRKKSSDSPKHTQTSLTSPASEDVSPPLSNSPNASDPLQILLSPDGASSVPSSKRPSSASEFGYNLTRFDADNTITPQEREGTASSGKDEHQQQHRRETGQQQQIPPSSADSTAAVSFDHKSTHETDAQHARHLREFGPSAPQSGSQSRPGSSPKDQFFHGLAGRISRGSSLKQKDDMLNTQSPSLLRYSTGGDFSMDEDIHRILAAADDAEAFHAATNPMSPTHKGNEHTATPKSSIFKRMSDSVRHARSMSDRGVRPPKEKILTQSPRSPTTPGTIASLAHELNSPAITAASWPDDVLWLKAELQREKAKTVERDARIAEMEKEMQNLANDNTRLRVNKRLVSLLDINERIAKDRLEGLAHEREKLAASDSNGHHELSEKASEFIREFSMDVERLREAYQEEIERQIQRRNDIMEEVAEQERQKQNCLQEFAQLSIKNAQLTDMNNEIVVQIRALYKANSGNAQAAVTAAAAQDVMSPPPLPASHHSTKASTDASMGSSAALNSVIHHDDASSMAPSSVSTAEQSTPAVTVLQGPQVVNIRKGQPRKFMWKRGGQNVAKVTKGIRGAFTSREGQPGAGGTTAAPGNANNGHQFVETPAYNNLPPGGAVETVGGDYKQGGFGFFANQRNKPRTATAPAVTHAAGNGAANDGPVGLFGTDLVDRIEVEKEVIPVVVTRCIEEVEKRGMDVEGIYRKSGGSSQVQMIQQGFERNPKEVDISDADIDIHSVTSVLKQYFRKLPTPLITYEAYDHLLDSNDVEPVPARVEAVQRALSKLPRVHRDVLEFLVFHLRRVAERESENLMTTTNVAVVLAPTIMRPQSLSREMADVQRKNEALKFLVENCQDVFMGMED